ncbi:MAG TPA: isochorismatase family cysteine hydrolase [Candidatus Acidoferrales bacterium]
MVSRDVIFWAVDTQADFMLPDGKLYVPGAEHLLPNLIRLTDEARQDRVLLISHGCIHTPDDPEFAQFPAHCIRDTPGSKFVPHALADRVFTVPNHEQAALPEDLSAHQQILLEKDTLDVFQSLHVKKLIDRLNPQAEIFVFGVVTEICVRFAVRGLLEHGRHVSIVEDAIATLNPAEGQRAIDELRNLGAKIVSTEYAISRARESSQNDRRGQVA